MPRPLAERPLIVPAPQQMERRDGAFALDEDVALLLPANATEEEKWVVDLLAAALVDRYGLALQTLCTDTPPKDVRAIAVGMDMHPLTGRLASDRRLDIDEETLGEEGYVLDVCDSGVLLTGVDSLGLLYGLQSLRQLIDYEEGRCVPGVTITDFPRTAFRGMRMFLPGAEHLPFFKRFVRDFALPLKYNTLILEMNGAMRLDRHPEVNAGTYEFARCLNRTRRDRPAGPGGAFQDSAHHDAGDFGVVEKDDVADLCGFARQHGFEIIPEVPSLTHAYYLLARHREFAEIPSVEWPDTYCPGIPEVYELYVDVLEEIIEVMQPSTVHIGHDEWRMPMGHCDRCRDKDHGALFAEDVKKIHSWLSERGLRTAMWGDHLLESVRQKGTRDTKSPAGHAYQRPGALTPEQVVNDIPKDILLFNWFWSEKHGLGGESNDRQFSEWGFEQVYGNMTHDLADENYAARLALPGVVGGAPSTWVGTTEFNFGKDMVRDFVGCAPLLWSPRRPEGQAIERMIQAVSPMVRRMVSAEPLPSAIAEKIEPVDVSVAACVSLDDLPGEVPLDALETDGPLVAVGVKGEGECALAAESDAIPVGLDVDSLVFTHACALRAKKVAGHVAIYNVVDCADLLGWYEVTYDDGFRETAPVRYGINILEWSDAQTGPQERIGQVYWAEPIDCAREGEAPLAFFRYEWVNPRPGRVIREVRLCGTRDFVDARGKPIASNAIVLAALDAVPAAPAPDQPTIDESYA